MKNLFVSYELATRLKEFFFKEECIGYYPNKVDGLSFQSYQTNTNIHDDYILLGGYPQKGVSAPTHQQVVDWLRDVFDVAVNVHYQHDREYCYTVTGFKEAVLYDEGGETSDYYESLIKAIQLALILIDGGVIRKK